MQIIKVIVLCLIYFEYSEGELNIKLWGCPNVDTVRNFSLEGFTGVWYEMESDLNAETFLKHCQMIRVKKLSIYQIELTFTQRLPFLNIKKETVFDGTLQGDKSRGKFILRERPKIPLPIPLPIPLKKGKPFWVIDTDYVNYAVTLECQAFLNKVHTQRATIYSRYRSLPPHLLEKARSSLVQNGIDTRKIKKRNQNCF